MAELVQWVMISVHLNINFFKFLPHHQDMVERHPLLYLRFFDIIIVCLHLE
jgi:hypothetical protein